MLPTVKVSDGSTAVVVCPHVDQHCATVMLNENGLVVVGSTQHCGRVLLTRDEYEQLLAHGAEALQQAERSDERVTIEPQPPVAVSGCVI